MLSGIDEEAYFLPMDEIIRRAKEASDLKATELCIQAGLPPNMNPRLYESIAKEIKATLPHMYLHAFSPEEVKYSAKRNNISVREMLERLKAAGVDSLPGTSAEILNDDIRYSIAKGRISTKEWIDVITTAHSLNIPTTSTMMYGHVEAEHDVANHIDTLRNIQAVSLDKYSTGK